MSVESPFPKDEYKIRYKKAKKLMADEGLDALIATDITNYIYLGGHKIRLSMTGSRPQVLILPRDDEPILIAQKLFEQLINQTSWIKNVKLWQEFPFTVTPLEEALEEFGLTEGRIGVDLGGEYLLGIPYEILEKLKKKMPKVDFVNGTKVFLKLRLTKTSAEISCLRKVCDMTSRAYEKLFDTLKPGMTEKEIANSMIDYMLEEGSDEECWTNPRIFPGTALLGPPTDLRLESGRTLFIDSGATYKGYRADFSRLAVVGEPSDRLNNMYELCKRITWKEVEATKPGLKASEIAKIGSLELHKAGVKPKPAGRDGHGLGLGGLELPSICLNDNTVLESGMVITMEPEVSSITIRPEIAGQMPEFRFVQEENVLVTEGGYEVLSWASRGLHRI